MSGRNHRRPATVGDQARSRSVKLQCPKCGRKDALRFTSNESFFGGYCRYDGCDHEAFIMRDELPH